MVPAPRMAPDPRTLDLAHRCPAGGAVVLHCCQASWWAWPWFGSLCWPGEGRTDSLALFPLLSQGWGGQGWGAGGRAPAGDSQTLVDPLALPSSGVHIRRKEVHPSAYSGGSGGSTACRAHPGCPCPWRDLCQAGQVGGTDGPGAGWDGVVREGCGRRWVWRYPGDL